jgi:hypothetical protein
MSEKELIEHALKGFKTIKQLHGKAVDNFLSGIILYYEGLLKDREISVSRCCACQKSIDNQNSVYFSNRNWICDGCIHVVLEVWEFDDFIKWRKEKEVVKRTLCVKCRKLFTDGEIFTTEDGWCCRHCLPENQKEILCLSRKFALEQQDDVRTCKCEELKKKLEQYEITGFLHSYISNTCVADVILDYITDLSKLLYEKDSVSRTKLDITNIRNCPKCKNGQKTMQYYPNRKIWECLIVACGYIEKEVVLRDYEECPHKQLFEESTECKLDGHPCMIVFDFKGCLYYKKEKEEEDDETQKKE